MCTTRQESGCSLYIGLLINALSKAFLFSKRESKLTKAIVVAELLLPWSLLPEREPCDWSDMDHSLDDLNRKGNDEWPKANTIQWTAKAR